MADENIRNLEREAAGGDQDAIDRLFRARCKAGDHSVLRTMRTYPELQPIADCPFCGKILNG